ncbi:MAG: LysM peptidoglycan-binding domain-containing protein [Proteobacteria bacterium]|nr:LysM peptidoglycan-binding domain-containing protein [Pseudomonadota bacterium]
MRKILICFFLVLFSCAPFPKEEIAKTKLEIEGLYYADLPKYLPQDWLLLKELWQKLEEVEQIKNREEAYRLNYYINYKISQIEEKLNAKKREEEEKIRQAKILLEEAKREEEKKEELKDTSSSEVKKSEITMEEQQEQKKIASLPKQKKTLEDIRYKIEKRLPSFYTVKEEDTLEKIAELPFIYNDKYYWPLIYKYNRDQISNPKRLYKGQILKIPRNITMDEIYKAREDAGAISPKNIPKRAYTPDKYKQIVNELLMEE